MHHQAIEKRWRGCTCASGGEAAPPRPPFARMPMSSGTPTRMWVAALRGSPHPARWIVTMCDSRQWGKRKRKNSSNTVSVQPCNPVTEPHHAQCATPRRPEPSLCKLPLPLPTVPGSDTGHDFNRGQVVVVPTKDYTDIPRSTTTSFYRHLHLLSTLSTMSNVQGTVESGTISVVPQLETMSEEDLAARLFPDGTINDGNWRVDSPPEEA